ncbi:MAG: hypothetical protein DMF75_06650 [Acidobacteria bacterium]|nr:MAG: hypothetical protein DMF75_06650 [Acidobacteriota bacterium]PYS64403.1 MAG: hypothetical protein DMF76_04760 [Acidobacteriota bacterium]
MTTGNQSTKELEQPKLTREKIFESLTSRKARVYRRACDRAERDGDTGNQAARVALNMTKAARASRLGSAAFAVNSVERFSASRQLTKS